MTDTTWLFYLSGTVFVCLGIPLILKRIKPNRYYGFRIKETLSDKQIWYEANRIAGIDLFLAGVVIIVTAFITQQQSSDFPTTAVNLAVLIVCSVTALIHSFLTLPKGTKN